LKEGQHNTCWPRKRLFYRAQLVEVARRQELSVFSSPGGGMRMYYRLIKMVTRRLRKQKMKWCQ